MPGTTPRQAAWSPGPRGRSGVPGLPSRAGLLGTAGLLAAAAIGWAASVGTARAAVDVAALWDFADPALSERRFREALAGAQGDDAIVLQTQIARTQGLRRNLTGAKDLLRSLEPQLAGAGAEARARHALEWGRNHISAVTKPEERTPENLAAARAAYERALAVAREGRLDELAIDAVHMMAFVDNAPAEQLKWNEQALAMVLASTQPGGRAWEASIRNNLAYSLHQLGRHAEALPHYERALALREAAGARPRARYVARWLVARELRLVGRLDEALALQTQLEGQMHVVGDPDPYVLEELERIHRARGDEAQAAQYARRLAAARRPS